MKKIPKKLVTLLLIFMLVVSLSISPVLTSPVSAAYPYDYWLDAGTLLPCFPYCIPFDTRVTIDKGFFQIVILTPKGSCQLIITGKGGVEFYCNPPYKGYKYY